MRRILVAVIVLTLLMPETCFACLWDYDTIAMERERFPEAQELIAGHFVRHSVNYYEWRIKDRTAKPVEDRSPLDFDDIAVSYDKLGQHDRAIEVIQSKIKRWPVEGKYESQANLGTFHIHAGRFKEGLRHISKAIEINPNAHFGREVYQKLLVEYVIACKRDGKVRLPLNDKSPRPSSGFAAFVMAAKNSKNGVTLAETQAAVRGVMGMMRFGNHESPILLETLGDLLYSSDLEKDSKMLAARAYLKASYETDDDQAAMKYREKASQVIELQFKKELSEVEMELKHETGQGDKYFREIAADEKSWAAAGKDLDLSFANKYYDAPSLDLKRPHRNPKGLFGTVARVLLVAGALLLVGGTVFVSMAIRKSNFRDT